MKYFSLFLCFCFCLKAPPKMLIPRYVSQTKIFVPINIDEFVKRYLTYSKSQVYSNLVNFPSINLGQVQKIFDHSIFIKNFSEKSLKDLKTLFLYFNKERKEGEIFVVCLGKPIKKELEDFFISESFAKYINKLLSRLLHEHENEMDIEKKEELKERILNTTTIFALFSNNQINNEVTSSMNLLTYKQSFLTAEKLQTTKEGEEFIYAILKKIDVKIQLIRLINMVKHNSDQSHIHSIEKLIKNFVQLLTKEESLKEFGEIKELFEYYKNYDLSKPIFIQGIDLSLAENSELLNSFIENKRVDIRTQFDPKDFKDILVDKDYIEGRLNLIERFKNFFAEEIRKTFNNLNQEELIFLS